ncbi:sorbosone dehydrogenase family protein [Marivirga sp. S37H4]|uniref:Sorbosone dehydrogenase family protein n=2 Tax=Marivirga aurantiaca TaxID=2802615 RepID=A0A935C8D7_9BACT|nr:sorbosone dehydrogenase family protein [Marivirga aurantiaca]
MYYTNRILTIALVIILWSCGGEKKQGTENEAPKERITDRLKNKVKQYSGDERLASINLPENFHISVFAEVPNARSMALSENGTLFVGNRGEDKVYAVKDTDNDGIADEKYVIAEGLSSPNGVAFKDGDLYVAEISRIIKFSDIENNLANPPAHEVIYDEFPTDKSHGWKYIAFGPDGKLYVPVGAPCNICNPEKDIYASITRMNADGTEMEIYAEGIRNTVGFTWHPETRELYFTDNGRDMMGDSIPPCELNIATQKGQHFGYPFCHGGNIADPEFGSLRDCNEFKKPYRNLGPHVAPLGLKFYTADMFPAEYKNQIFIAEHGSWNRSEKIGYRIQMVSDTKKGKPSYETFIDGWLNESEQEAWGRPVDVIIDKEGAMLISDDKAGLIYRVVYKG